MLLREKYLIVMPRLVEKVGDGYAFPLGIAYVSASMKKIGSKVETINLNHIEGNVNDIIINLIKQKNITTVLTGGQSFLYGTIREIIESVKKYDSKIITIVGGGIITADPKIAMQALKYVDYGIIGEGEITVNELCDALENHLPLEEIAGIIYQKNKNYFTTKRREEILDLDTLPWPDYEGFDFKKYIEEITPTYIAGNKSNSLFMLTSRSCPFQCTFCFHTVGQKYRQRSLDAVFEELEYLAKNYDIKFIFFVDELFGSNINRLRDFCKRIKKYHISWWSQFRVNDITMEKVQLLKNAGCEIMSFGLESADNRILKSMQKGICIEQIEKTLQLVYEEGVSIEGCFIFGDIAETYETSMNTLNWWRAHAEYKINLGPISIYPGTYLYKYAIENHLIKDPVKFLQGNCPQTNVSKMSDKEFSKIMKIIMEESISLKKKLKDVKIFSADYQFGEIGLEGTCSSCGHINQWKKAKIFSITSLLCEVCRQRYDVPILPSMEGVFNKNLQDLLLIFDKIAIWGINDKVTDLILKSELLKKSNIYFIDISKIKQNMCIASKKICSPSSINDNKIETVIIGVPFLFSAIQGQIKAEYKTVKNIIDITMLFDPNFKIK